MHRDFSKPPPLRPQTNINKSQAEEIRNLRARLSNGIGSKKQNEKARNSILSPDELDRYNNLLVFARTKVEGYFAGKHKSPVRGSSGEFVDFKKYVPGDNIQQIDWKIYGRNRRLFRKQFEEETDMVAYIMVDISRSMAFSGKSKEPKALLAAKIAAALSYLMIKQGDQVALGLFDTTLHTFVSPGGTQKKLHEITRHLESVTPSNKTGIAGSLEKIEPLLKKRGRLVILSDFMDDNDAFLEALARVQHRKFEILLLQILHPDERELTTNQAARYVDMETGEEIRVDPAELRSTYKQRMDQSIRNLSQQAANRQIEHSLIDATDPYHSAIETYLGLRKSQIG